MEFKHIGCVGKGRLMVQVKIGVVGTMKMIVLAGLPNGEHILAMNETAAKELITHLRTGLRELERFKE